MKVCYLMGKLFTSRTSKGGSDSFFIKNLHPQFNFFCGYFCLGEKERFITAKKNIRKENIMTILLYVVDTGFIIYIK